MLDLSLYKKNISERVDDLIVETRRVDDLIVHTRNVMIELL